MARLENRTYEEILAHLERELELNALEESDDLPMPTMASASTNIKNLLSNGINTNMDAQSSYCKATGHYNKSCRKLKKKKELEDKRTKTAKSPNVHHIQNAPHARKRITPPNDAGKEVEHTYVLRGRDLKIKPMKPPGMRNHPRSQPTLKLHLQANQLLEKMIRKTKFATTPNT